MMDIWHPDTLLLFLTVFLPGFISLKVWDLLVPNERRDSSKALFDALAYSTLNFAFLAWVYLPELSQPSALLQSPLVAVPKLLLAFLVAPILWPILLRWLLTSRWLARFVVSPIKRPWDYVFGRREPYWIIVHLKDGRAVGGRYGGSSFASSYPVPEQIYLQEIWHLDDDLRFMHPIQHSKGALFFKDEIRAIEFFEYKATEGKGS